MSNRTKARHYEVSIIVENGRGTIVLYDRRRVNDTTLVAHRVFETGYAEKGELVAESLRRYLETDDGQRDAERFLRAVERQPAHVVAHYQKPGEDFAPKETIN